ncbi:MAG: sialidase-1 [Verrucomicrobia bacterium]|nr:MAG: sialidase-1 [Verrucomicrobiota bacterium]
MLPLPSPKTFRATLLSAFLLLGPTAPVQSAEPDLQKTDLFKAGENGFALYRIPGIVVTAKGTALAYCEARSDARSDWGEIQVHLRRSPDGGKTWEPARQIAHIGERITGNPRKAKGGEDEMTVNNPVAIVDSKSGAVHFLTRCGTPSAWEASSAALNPAPKDV